MADNKRPDGGLIREPPPWEGRSPSRIVMNMIELSKTPNEWGRIATYSLASNASQTASDLRLGRRKRPEGRWEFVNGPTDNGRFGIWARYLGLDEPTTDNDEETDDD